MTRRYGEKSDDTFEATTPEVTPEIETPTPEIETPTTVDNLPPEPAPPPPETYKHLSCGMRSTVSDAHPKLENGAWCSSCNNYYGLAEFQFDE